MRCCLKTCPWLIQCQNHFCTASGLLPRISASTTGLRGMAGLLTMHFSFANAKLRLCALVRRNDVSKQNLESIVEFLGPLGNTQLTPLNLQARHKMSRKSKSLPKCTFRVSLTVRLGPQPPDSSLMLCPLSHAALRHDPDWASKTEARTERRRNPKNCLIFADRLKFKPQGF